MPIAIAPSGQKMKILKILTDEKTKKHLENLGLTVNSDITVLSKRRRIATMWKAIIHGVAIAVGSCLAAVGWMVCIQGRSSLILMGKDRLANLSCYLRRIRIFIFVL